MLDKIWDKLNSFWVLVVSAMFAGELLKPSRGISFLLNKLR